MNNNLWQQKSISEIEKLFQNADEIKAVILFGSLADDTLKIDEWSDIDLKIIVDESALKKYYPETTWINKLGKVFSVEKSSSDYFHTVRVCLEDLRRFDITFIALEALKDMKKWSISEKYKILKSTIPDLDALLQKIPKDEYKGINDEWLQSFQGNFWHKAVLAITKLMRNDLLIAQHLALDLERDCLVLKMNERDQHAGNNVHREGGYGNELVKELSLKTELHSAKDILKNIELYCEKFDELSVQLNGAESKITVLKKFTEKALKELERS